jgi:hypothetical protein
LAPATEGAVRSALLEKYHIDYLLLLRAPGWLVDRPPSDHRVELVANFENQIFLYRVTPLSQ